MCDIFSPSRRGENEKLHSSWVLAIIVDVTSFFAQCCAVCAFVPCMCAHTHNTLDWVNILIPAVLSDGFLLVEETDVSFVCLLHCTRTVGLSSVSGAVSFLKPEKSGLGF